MSWIIFGTHGIHILKMGHKVQNACKYIKVCKGLGSFSNDPLVFSAMFYANIFHIFSHMLDSLSNSSWKESAGKALLLVLPVAYLHVRDPPLEPHFLPQLMAICFGLCFWWIISLSGRSVAFFAFSIKDVGDLPFLLFDSNLPWISVDIKFVLAFLIACPMYLSLFLLTSFSTCCCAPSSSRTLSLVLLSVHLTRSSLL